MEDLETSQINAATDDFSLIDVSASDDDFLWASSSGNIVRGVPSEQPCDSLDLQKPIKAGKCNLRKSLAWDSAFFTNAGVLDPEELSSIIEGAEMGVKQNLYLPGIQEELSKSTDSTSSLQSDSVTLESIEADLFSDIRASVQKCSKSSTTGHDRDSGIPGEDESKNASSKKILEPSSSKLMKPKSASNKFNVCVQGSAKSVMKPPVNRSRDNALLLAKPVKAAAGSCVATSTKRMSDDASRVKQDVKAAGNLKGAGKVASSSKAVRQVDSRKPLPKAPVVPKASAISSVPKLLAKASVVPKVSAASSVLNNRTMHSSRSSCDNASSSASENVRKSQIGVIRKKADKNANLLSGSKIRTSSKVAEKVKSQVNGSRLSDYVKSTTQPSSSISPASSISEWSTESSSSTATNNQKHFGLSRYSPSSQDVVIDSGASQNLHNPSSDNRAFGVLDNEVPEILGQSAKQLSTESAVSNRTNIRSGFAKPSGLRLPSPNIGFFDGAKVGAKTPSSSSRSRSALSSTLPRSVSISPSGITRNKTNTGVNASKLTTAAARTAKPKQQMIDANLKTAAPVLDHSADLKNPSGVDHIDKDFDTSDCPTSIAPKSALERNEIVSEAPVSATHVPYS